MDNWDPSSYSYQEAMGQVPTFFRLAQFRIHGGSGVPSNSIGADGDFFLRSDGAAGANTCLYHKEAGAWAGLTA